MENTNQLKQRNNRIQTQIFTKKVFHNTVGTKNITTVNTLTHFKYQIELGELGNQ